MRQALESLENLPFLTYMIPMALIILGFGFGAWAIYWDYRKKQLMYEERRLMVERGITPPPPIDPYANTPAGAWVTKHKLDFEERRLMIEKGMMPPPPPPKKNRAWQDYLRFGLVTLFLGIGLALASLFLIHTGNETDAGPIGAWGAVIGMAGLGLTIYALIVRKAPKS